MISPAPLPVSPFSGLPHGQRNPLFGNIHRDHPHLDHIADLEHLAWVLDKAVADFRDMHQAVLVYADVHKSAEVNDIAHGARQLHAGLQVLNGEHVRPQQRRRQLVARVAAGTQQLRHNVAQGRLAHTDLFRGSRVANGLHLFRQPGKAAGAHAVQPEAAELTHAHSWIMSFDDEYHAFRAYADLYPDSCTLLVDTYDTLRSGVPNAIRVFEELRAEGHMPKHYGIRLDSGDLAYLTKKARIMLDEAGFPDAVIAASGGLDENLITSLKSQGAPITSWGVGTKLITSADCPAFGGVYKLAASKPKGADEFTAKIKISENPAKITNPGNKTIYRIYGKEDGKIRGDLICLVGEHYDESDDLTIFDPQATWKKSTLAGGTYTMRELLVPIFIKGQCVYKSPSVMDIRSYCKDELNTLWDESRRLVNPQEVYVDLSMPLYKLKNELLDANHKK